MDVRLGLDPVERRLVEAVADHGGHAVRMTHAGLRVSDGPSVRVRLFEERWCVGGHAVPSPLMARLLGKGALEPSGAGASTTLLGALGERFRPTLAALAEVRTVGRAPGISSDPERLPLIAVGLGRDAVDGTDWAVAVAVGVGAARRLVGRFEALMAARAACRADAGLGTLHLRGVVVPVAAFAATAMRRVSDKVWLGEVGGGLGAGRGGPHDGLPVRFTGEAAGEPVRIAVEHPAGSDRWHQLALWSEAGLVRALLLSELGKEPAIGVPLLDGLLAGRLA